MKLKLLITVVVALAGLYLLNRWLGQKKEYISGVPAAATPGSGEVRQKFTVGFLPVT
ncbi:MAG: hypothetical protein ACKVXR_01700 [Planctomycetota bacterium]